MTTTVTARPAGTPPSCPYPSHATAPASRSVTAWLPPLKIKASPRANDSMPSVVMIGCTPP